MTLERAFRISLLTLVGSALATLTLALASPAWFLIGLGALAAHLVVGAVRPAWIVRRAWATLGVLITVQCAILESFLTESVLVPAGHCLIVIQLLWLVQERSNRNYGWLCVVGLFQVMLSGVLSVDLFFGLGFVIFLASGVFTLVLFNLRCELERNGQLTPSCATAGLSSRARSGDRTVGQADRGTEWIIGRRLLASGTLMVLGEMALTLVIFLYFPRFGFQLFQLSPLQRGRSLMGFGDQVRLGDLADILDNPGVVMSARLWQGGHPIRADAFPLLWRGIALDTYDGTTWSALGRFDRVSSYPLPYVGSFRFRHDLDITQDIALEPIGSRVLFSLFRPVRIESRTPNLDEVLYDHQSDAWSPLRSSAVSLSYSVRSLRAFAPLAELRKPVNLAEFAGFRPDQKDPPRALRLPPTFSPRVRALAEEIVRDTPKLHYYERAQAIETFLKEHYTYSLQRGIRSRGLDPVEDFLIHQKRGHCEYFAAGMVVLCRTLGIPARLVQGFSGGEWNEYGQFYVIRQRNAHAWAEVFIPRFDWVAFDPTPASDTASASDAGLLGRLDRRLAYLRLAWNAFVVNYSTRDQLDLARTLTRLASNLPNLLPQWGYAGLGIDSGLAVGLNAGLIVAVGLGALLAMAFGAVRLRRRLRRGPARARGPRVAVAFYKRLTDLLRHRGFRRGPATTPREFAQTVMAAGGESYTPVELITEAFCRVRYGGASLTPAERAEIARALAALKRKRC